jgi:hypothetical protein
MMELVLSNAQGELSPLERGVHALAATEKGDHNGKSIAAYAALVGRPERSVGQEIEAARVASNPPPRVDFGRPRRQVQAPRRHPRCPGSVLARPGEAHG